jgi:RimJ/RimL family protein N-acetyltransferase
MTMRVREATPADAAKLVALLHTVYAETPFMLFEAGESTLTEGEQARRLEERSHSGYGVTFVCEVDDELVGAVTGNRGGARRTHHSLYVVIGVRQSWVGRGVGRALLQALEGWALSRGVHRLELTVAVDNSRAIALYEKCGFEREGVKRHSRKIDGRYTDEFYMSRLLPP